MRAVLIAVLAVAMTFALAVDSEAGCRGLFRSGWLRGALHRVARPFHGHGHHSHGHGGCAAGQCATK